MFKYVWWNIFPNTVTNKGTSNKLWSKMLFHLPFVAIRHKWLLNDWTVHNFCNNSLTKCFQVYVGGLTDCLCSISLLWGVNTRLCFERSARTGACRRRGGDWCWYRNSFLLSFSTMGENFYHDSSSVPETKRAPQRMAPLLLILVSVLQFEGKCSSFLLFRMPYLCVYRCF